MARFLLLCQRNLTILLLSSSWQKWNVKDITNEVARLFFSHVYYCYQGINGALLTEDEPLDIKYLFYRPQVPLFFPLPIVVDGYMDLNCNFPAHKNILTRICTRPCLFSSFFIKTDTAAHQSTESPMPIKWGLQFLSWTILLQFFPLSTQHFCPFFLLTKFCLPRLYLEL